MYSIYGLLPLSPTEALQKFLEVTNPEGNIYHANFLLQKIEKLRQNSASYRKKPKYPRRKWSGTVSDMVEQSYAEALRLHEISNPSGQPPKSIKMRRVWNGWVISYQKASVLIGLLIPRNELWVPSVLLKGNSEKGILKHTTGFGKECVWQQPVITPPKPFTKAYLDYVDIPLGDLLDFLDKYR